MPVYVSRRARKAPPLETPKVRSIALRMLRELSLEEGELSILLTDDEGIRELNREHRDQNKATDVLAFPQDITSLDQPIPEGGGAGLLLGDVVISLDTAARQASSRKRSLLEEVRFLLAHGLLHLVGYDHATPEEKRQMTRATRRLVRAASS